MNLKNEIDVLNKSLAVKEEEKLENKENRHGDQRTTEEEEKARWKT